MRTIAFCALTATLLVAGCKTNPANYQQADRTGKELGAFRKEVVEIKKAVDAATAALGEVVAAASTDPRKPFQRFSQAVDGVATADARAKKQAETMRAGGKEFFAKWQAEMAAISNPEIKQLAEQRKTEVEASFRNISRVIVQLKDDFGPWFSDVQDLRRFLSSDLTAAGISASRSMIDRTKAGAAKVQQSLDALFQEVDTVAKTMTPARVPKS